MKKSAKIILTISFICQCIHSSTLLSDDGYELWMKYRLVSEAMQLKKYRQQISAIMVSGTSETCQIIRDELKRGLDGLLGEKVPLTTSLSRNGLVIVGTLENLNMIRKSFDTKELLDLGKEGFLIQSGKVAGYRCIIISANDEIGLLYGVFHFLRLIQIQADLGKIHIASKPRIQYRLLNHWDNLDGRVERGYAGRSLWRWNELPEKVGVRHSDYARANASLGINGTVINNVNANPDILKPEYLKKVAKLAEVFRPYGIRVFLSINFSSPISAKFHIENSRRAGIGDLSTSDPMNPEVRQWWKDKAAEIYQFIPDFGGFLVKANSEGMPGPQDYDRTHADGANMLAEALAPRGGVVMWRAFVYNADTDPDRAKRAYKEFVPLDGQFHSNVFVQGKNGPIDFQPREPVQPLFGAMPKTPMMLELQITQEYLGHSTHLVYLAPMWKEYLEFDLYAKGPGSTLAKVVDGSLFDYKMSGIAGVTNIGDDRNWCGHFFAQANWYAYGRLAWDHTLSAGQIADEWIRMSLTREDSAVQTIKDMMMGSREACVNYMTPLGLHHIMQPDFHYGPGPDHTNAPRLDWTSVYYHRADSVGLGFDRTTSGSNAVGQYFSPLKEKFNDIETCPEKYLLWFHHVPWNYSMHSGRTLWQELCQRYCSGTDYVDQMAETWALLKNKIDPEIHRHVSDRLRKQQKDAKIWRDACLKYFQHFSQMEIVGNR